MMRLRHIGVVAGVVLLAGACRSLFPQGSFEPFVDRWYSEQLRAAHEPALHPTGSQDREVYRFSIIPSFGPTITMRVTKSGGEYQLTTKRLTGAGGYQPGKIGIRRDRLLTSAEAAMLRQWIAEMNFWAMPTAEPPVPQPPDVVVIVYDGTQFLLEAADAVRYHVVDRSQPRKTSHPAFTQVCLCLLVWSGAFEAPVAWFALPDQDREVAGRCGQVSRENSVLRGRRKVEIAGRSGAITIPRQGRKLGPYVQVTEP